MSYAVPPFPAMLWGGRKVREMYQLLALLTGAVISGMVAVNGGLSAGLGVFLSAVVIHIVGTAFAFLLCRLRGERLFRRLDVPAWAYLGGVIGVIPTVAANFAFGRISVTCIVALELLGQSALSAAIDGLGLLGMAKRPIRLSTWAGLAVSCLGVAVMLDSGLGGAMAAVLASLAAGVCLVLNRTVNARLAEKSGALAGSFYNHLTGLPCCAALWLLLPDLPLSQAAAPPLWAWLGGILGVLVVLLYNVAVPRLPAFQVTLLSFLGQVFAGFAIDLFRGQDISGGLFRGGALCALGFLLSQCLDHCGARRAKGT